MKESEEIFECEGTNGKKDEGWETTPQSVVAALMLKISSLKMRESHKIPKEKHHRVKP